jgi:hypothetical protein
LIIIPQIENKQVGIFTGNTKACTNNILLSKLNEIPTGILQVLQSEFVNRRRSDNTMMKRKGQTTINKTYIYNKR